jgi:hypothetical protein
MRKFLLVFFSLACTLGFCQENISYQFKIGLTSKGAAEKLQPSASHAVLKEVLQALAPFIEVSADLCIVSAKEDLDPVALETTLNSRGLLLSYFEKNTFSQNGDLLMVVYYKPAPRDAARVKK